MLWEDLEKHPPLFRVGRLPRQCYLPNEFARAMSIDFSEIQTDSGKVYRVFLPNSTKQLYMTFSKKFGEIRQQKNRSVVSKKQGSSASKMGIIFETLSLFGKIPFSRDRLIISAKGAEIR